MADREHDTTVINSDGGSGGAAWFVIGAVLVIALIAGFFYLGDPGSDNVNVTVDTPQVEAPASTGSTDAAPSTGSNTSTGASGDVNTNTN